MYRWYIRNGPTRYRAVQKNTDNARILVVFNQYCSKCMENPYNEVSERLISYSFSALYKAGQFLPGFVHVLRARKDRKPH